MTDNKFIENEELQLIKAQLRIQNTILNFAKELLTLHSSEEIVWAITENIIGELNFFDCVIYLFDETGLNLVQRSAFGPKNPYPKKIKDPLILKIGKGIVGTVAKTGISEIISDTRNDPRYIPDDEIRLSEITVPILIEGKVIGIIDAEHPEVNFFNENHLKFITTIASLSALTLQNALNKEKLEKQKENLEIEIAKRTQKLEDTLLELKRSNEDLKNFAHVVSHDLKQPLRTINGFINLIKRKELNLSEKSKEYFSFVSDGSLRMQEIVNGLLNFSKVANLDHSETKFDLNHIVNKVVEDLSYQIRECEATLEVEDLPSIIGFETLIKLVFQNLISNSLKFRHKKRKTLIEISFTEINDHYIFYIKDNGIGIPKLHQQKVFEMFKTMHPNHEYEGTGMGLSFCKKIVERHGGSMHVSSAGENLGTTVSFSLSKTVS